GGLARRLTFVGGSVCVVCGWSADGSRIFFTSDYGSPFERDTQAFEVSTEGGAPRPLRLGHVATIAIASNNAALVGRNALDAARWKRYHGGTAGDLWVDPNGTGTFRRLISLRGNLIWPMWIGQRVFFVSDHEGIANIYSCTSDGTDLQRHTDEREYYARYPSTDGRSIVYGAGAELRVLDTVEGSVRTIDVTTPSTAPQTVRRFVESSERLEHFAPSPDGTQIALVSRGQPYAMPLWEEAVTHYGRGSRVRYRLAEWLPDSYRLVVVDDAEGYERIIDIDLAKDQPEKPHVLTDTRIGRVVELTVSREQGFIAFTNHRRELFILDPGRRELRKIDESPGDVTSRLAFSPDGRYLAYTWSPSHDVGIIRVCKVKSGEKHDVTSPLRVDANVAWDPDGDYLYFLSTRDFNPVY
ncbi:MAG: S41 family peptidase, partial [Vulcanimicrobiaceae bacterium]